MILCIIQARMGSSRLSGKVLKSILGKPMLGHMIERLKRSQLIGQITVATSVAPADDAIELFCNDNNIICFRGSEENVLDRFAGCAALFPEANHVLRLTGDCPLIDPTLMDNYIKSYLQLRPDIDHYHLGSPNFPRGLDAEIFSYEALKQAAEKATSDYEKEHVTPYIYQHPDRFTSATYPSGEDHSLQRWCVDEEADFKLVAEIFERLYPENSKFTWQDVLQLLDQHPQLMQINKDIVQKNS